MVIAVVLSTLSSIMIGPARCVFDRYLAAFCKPCPTKEAVEAWKDNLWKTQGLKFEFTDTQHPKTHGCGKMIYKDGGCNHIWSCPCDFHWCWQV